jgi:ppGpp synthetase/RelA/SpoT-type nucleotidyltranferase
VDEFKEAAKISGKVRQRGQPVTFQSFLQLSDIIGLTIVVQYPDQVDKVISAVEGALQKIGINIEEREDHQKRNGFLPHILSVLDLRAWIRSDARSSSRPCCMMPGQRRCTI